MTQSELSELVYKATNKSISTNKDSIIPVLTSLQKSIQTGNKLDDALFNFFMEAVHMGVTASIQTLKELDVLDISS